MGLVIGTLWLQTNTPSAVMAAVAGLGLFALSVFAQHYFLPQPLEEPPFGATPLFVTLRVLLFGVPIALIVYALIACERRFSWRPPALLVAIGDCSYSIYLYHFMTLSVLGRMVLALFGDRGLYAGIVLFVGGFLLVNLVGYGLYFFFERPTLKWLHRIGPAISTPALHAEAVHADRAQSRL